MASDGPTIYIDNRPYLPAERIVRRPGQDGDVVADRVGRQVRVVDRVTISRAARQMYQETYGESLSNRFECHRTYTRFRNSKPFRINVMLFEPEISAEPKN